MLVSMTLFLSEGSLTVLLPLVYRQYYLFWCTDKITPFEVQTNYSLAYQADIPHLKCWVWLFILDVTALAIHDMFSSWSELGMNHSLGMLPLLYRSLLFSLLCHWLVGRFGRRGLLNVVPLAGVLKRAVLLAELDRGGGSERVLCCDG